MRGLQSNMAMDDSKSLLEEVLELAQELSNSSRGAKVCQSQCNILRAAFGHVGDFLSEIQHLAAAGITDLSPVWKQAIGTLEKALRLIRSCEDEDWVMTTLMCEESRQDFQDVHSEFYDCIIELASAVLFQKSTSAADRLKVSEAYSRSCLRRVSASMLEAAAIDDRRQLMRLGLAAQEESDSDRNQALRQLSSLLLEKSAPVVSFKQLKFTQHLGHGGYGTVYEATWLDHLFAVKVFSPGDSSFRRELAALASNKHPNIVRMIGYSHDSDKQQHVLVMERMEMNLADLLAKRQLTMVDSVSVLLHIARGMAWLHSRDVIHRDLKPQNVLVCGENQFLTAKVADFGLARTNFLTSHVSYATPKQGTRIFMAPEVWNSDHYSKRSDVFSYAMICYQVLTGRLPFEKEVIESSDFMLRVCNGMRPRDEFPPACPEELVELTKLCWTDQPSQRPHFSDICTKLTQLKARVITNLTNLTEVRKNLVAAAASAPNSAPSSSSENRSSRLRVDLDSLRSRPSAVPQAVPDRRASPYSSNSESAGRRQQQYVVGTPSLSSNSGDEYRNSRKDELFTLVQKGKAVEAFTKAVALKDPETVWWLCSKLEPSLLVTFNRQLVLQVAEQINNDLVKDPGKKLNWMGDAIRILTSDYSSWSSTRLERLFEQLGQNLHGLLAVTPKQSEDAEFLAKEIEACNVWLERVRNACSTAKILGRVYS